MPVVAVVGPTAAGKSELAVELATRLAALGRSAQIVNADSMQLYRGMDIGTAKLPPDRRGGIPHHLLDVLDVTETATVADYQQRAGTVLAGPDVHLLVGGSALYVRAVVDDLRFPGTDPALRAALEDDLARLGPGALHARLAAADPAAAATIPPSNVRRVVRALEVVGLTGAPYAASFPSPAAGEPDQDPLGVLQLGVDVERGELDRRIDARVEAMFAAGLVDEVRVLEGHGLRDGRTASRAVGYAQVLGMLDGRIGEQDARAATARATRRLVRRQDAWFRKDPRVQWRPGGADWVEAALALVVPRLAHVLPDDQRPYDRPT